MTCSRSRRGHFSRFRHPRLLPSRALPFGTDGWRPFGGARNIELRRRWRTSLRRYRCQGHMPFARRANLRRRGSASGDFARSRAAAGDLEVGEVGLPELIDRRGLVLELVRRLDHHIGWTGDQVMGLQQPIDRRFRDEVLPLIGEPHGQFTRSPEVAARSVESMGHSLACLLNWRATTRSPCGS